MRSISFMTDRGPNAHLYPQWREPSGALTTPVDIGQVWITSAPTAVANGQHKLDVFYRGSNNHLWTSWWPDKPGGKWWSGAEYITETAAVSSNPSGFDQSGAKISRVFYTGTGGRLYLLTSVNGSPWQSEGTGVLMGTMISAASEDEVFFIGTKPTTQSPTGGLWRVYRSPQWHGPRNRCAGLLTKCSGFRD